MPTSMIIPQFPPPAGKIRDGTAAWNWGRRAVWVNYPTPLNDMERYEAKHLIDAGDRMLADMRQERQVA
jgi:hypothetical protein